MITPLRFTLQIALAVSFLAFATGQATAETTISYPTAEEATFTITVPDDWELTPAEEADDYFLVSGPTEVELWFRSIEVTSGEEASAVVEEAMTAGEEWLNELYKDCEFGEVTEGEREGMPFISLPGKGILKEGEVEVVFTIAFLFMENGSVAEFWGILPVGDEEGQTAAQAILDSFEAQ